MTSNKYKNYIKKEEEITICWSLPLKIQYILRFADATRTDWIYITGWIKIMLITLHNLKMKHHTKIRVRKDIEEKYGWLPNNYKYNDLKLLL